MRNVFNSTSLHLSSYEMKYCKSKVVKEHIEYSEMRADFKGQEEVNSTIIIRSIMLEETIINLRCLQ